MIEIWLTFEIENCFYDCFAQILEIAIAKLDLVPYVIRIRSWNLWYSYHFKTWCVEIFQGRRDDNLCISATI